MYEVWYASSHGFGHITRVMAQIEKKIDEDRIYRVILISGKNQIEFAKVYFKKYKERIIFRDIITDIGLVNKPYSLEVDKKELEIKLIEFQNRWNVIVEQEIKFLKSYSIDEIFTDVSPIGILVSKALGKRCNLVSNFTWYQQYRYLNLNSEIVKKYLELDQKIDVLYRYPLYLDFSHIEGKIKDIEFICREIDEEKIQNIKEEYGKSIFISCGKSADLGKIVINNFSGTIFVTSGLEVESLQGQVIELPIDTLDTQNYIGASEFIISKAGWGTIAEAVCNRVDMILLERDGILEDTHNIEEAKKITNIISKKLEECREIDYLKVKEELNKNGEKFKDICSRT